MFDETHAGSIGLSRGTLDWFDSSGLEALATESALWNDPDMK